MAQTGYTPISIYYSATATNTPTAGNLVAGELAINTNDGVLYYKDSSGVVQSIASKAGNSGSFTNLAYTGTLTGGTGIVNLGSGQFYKDASGNVGIGIASPTAKLHVSASTTGSVIVQKWTDSATDTGYLTTVTGGGCGVGAGGFLALGAGGGASFTERMRIDTSGNLLVGTTTANGKVAIYAASGQAPLYQKVFTNGDAGTFYANASNTIVGQVQVNSSSTAYVTSSDYRLKEEVKPMSNALDKIAQLKPCTYKWKIDGSDGEGFIAHELAEVMPQAVSGEKDAMNEDGTIKAQGIDTSFLVATLTAAIQELNAKVDAQANTIESMQSKLKDAGILGF